MTVHALKALVSGALAAVAAAVLRRPSGGRPQRLPGFPVLPRRADRTAGLVGCTGPESEGDVHEVPVPSQDRQQGYKRLFYILGKPGTAAVRLHVWCDWDRRTELLGFQVVTGIDSGTAINWQGGSSKDQFSIMEWSEDSYVFHPVSFSDNAGSVEELRRCADVLRASKLDRAIVEPVVSVLESRVRSLEAP